MSKLTDTQLRVLSSAAARDDGAATVPAKTSRTAAARLAASLLSRKLVREVRAKAGMPVWRKGEDGRTLCLIITPAGRKTIAVADKAVEARMESTLQAAPVEKTRSNKGAMKRRAANGEKSAPNKAGRLSSEPADKSRSQRDQPRPGSKRQLLIDLLSSPKGATIDQLVQALDWLPHTTRAELTRLRHLGFSIARTPRDKQASLYSLAAPAVSTAPIKVGEAA